MDSGKDPICLVWNLEGESSKDQGQGDLRKRPANGFVE